MYPLAFFRCQNGFEKITKPELYILNGFGPKVGCIMLKKIVKTDKYFVLLSLMLFVHSDNMFHLIVKENMLNNFFFIIKCNKKNRRY